ncbi:MAG: hypothetical protein D6753_01335 [Planctomycetota bacterium]|nr:MAG: hypothetical protein D6753_01335 [Planctomycetota bacterium]
MHLRTLWRMKRSAVPLLVTGVIWIVLTPGCRRGFYRQAADRQSYGILAEKGAGPSWSLPARFSIEPDPRSRFAATACLTDPGLPVPAPQLYSYEIPSLVTAGPPDRHLSMRGVVGADPVALASGLAQPEPALRPPFARSGVAEGQSGSAVVPSLYQQSSADAPNGPVSEDAGPAEEPASGGVQDSVPDSAPASMYGNDEVLDEIDALLAEFGQEVILRIPPIPQESWHALPGKCLRRMLEFEHIRAEYLRSFQHPPEPELLDDAQRVTLENILEMALINSREYQQQKENLYRTALRLTLQRFDYDLRFLRTGNGSSSNYTHARSGGTEVNTLGVPTGLGITRSLYTAGELVGRFANDVVLTFNGSSGYSSNVTSELLLQLSQPLIQRDVQFEPLTQAERDVVYAARQFVRFRKTLFRDLANQYYGLLLSYRSIAINTQDYFSNLGGFLRAEAMYAADRIPRFQVDQFEQNALRSRGNLIDACNSLERGLDRLKLAMGIPPETPLNMDLSELDDLTASDEATVVREQIRRAREYTQQQIDNEDPAVAIPAAAELARRMLSHLRVEQRMGTGRADAIQELRILVAKLEAEDKRLEARNSAAVLNQAFGDADVLPAQVFLRNEAILQSNLAAVSRELRLLRLAEGRGLIPTEAAVPLPEASDRADFEQLFASWQELVERVRELSRRQRELPNAEKAAKLPGLIAEAEHLLDRLRELEQACIERLSELGIHLAQTPEEWLAAADGVVQLSVELPFNAEIGLPPMKIDGDQAMLTALVQRLDLMNTRGQLADTWRQIKYAADALRSVIDIGASQSIRTPAIGNQPFDFSFDDSTTRLTLSVDTPLNRRTERNNYRLALINYNLALRNLMLAEDSIKLDIRNDIRSLELDQNQYKIAIASAALAYERVASTRLQLATGQGNITARDFLEAQQAYTQSLNSVAQQHIGFILDRIQFFLDLEQLQVDDLNFWPELRNEDYPMLPNLDFYSTAPDGYGRLPPGPWYSRKLRHMERVPSGNVVIHQAGRGAKEATTSPASDSPLQPGDLPESIQRPSPVNPTGAQDASSQNASAKQE